MLRKLFDNKIIILGLDIVLMIIAIICCKYIYNFELQKAVFTGQVEQFRKENEIPVFRIGKVILYSSANAVDDSDGKLENISISQFTDIAIYIDNKTKIQTTTAENTVREMYLDDIKLTMNTPEGDYIFNYKNPKKMGKFLSIEDYGNDKIWMKIISNNEEIKTADYNHNLFFTDCSNPISLGFINRNFIKNGVVSETSGQLAFDGSILKNANVDLASISGKIEFFIHIKNNLGENFLCNLVIDNDLTKDQESLYNGYSIRINDLKDEKYNFVKVSEDEEK